MFELPKYGDGVCLARMAALLDTLAIDRAWLQRPDPAVRFWEGETLALGEGVTLVRLGGHFPGGTVLHWAAGAGDDGALLSGDIVQVAPGADRVSFMWSYPNMRPLAGASVRRIAYR